jgi:integrase
MKHKPAGVPGVYSYELKDGSVLYGAIVDVRGSWGKERVQKRKEWFARLRDAKEWRLREQTDVLAGKTEAGGSRTFGWWVGEWLDIRSDDLEFSTRANYRVTLKKFAALYHMPLGKITPADIESILVQLRRQYRPGYVVRIRGSVSACFRSAMRLGLVGHNPVVGTSPIRPDRSDRVVWDAETVRRILEETHDDERWGMAWRLLAETWMRIGEACGLRWSDIDLDRRTIRVARTMRNADGGWVVGKSTKTKSSVRTLFISDQLAAMLRAWKDRQRFRGVKREEGLVIDRTPQAARKELLRVCARLGMPGQGPHMFRHAGITMAMRAGEDGRVVQQKAGHSNVAFTMQRYYHPHAEDHRQMTDRMVKLLG